MDDLTYYAEYAKSGRSSCKGCKQKIDQGTLRLAVMVQVGFFAGKLPNWHHEECFFKEQSPKTVTDIGGLDTLRSEDKKRISDTIENITGIIMPFEKQGKGKGKAEKRANNNVNAAVLKDFFVEYSKSSRATCRVCQMKISKDEIRIAKTVYFGEIQKKFGGQALWHHVKCFAKDRMYLSYLAGGEDLPGFNILKKEDQAIVKNEIKPLKSDEEPIKKVKAEPKDDEDVMKDQELDIKVEAQLFEGEAQLASSAPTETDEDWNIPVAAEETVTLPPPVSEESEAWQHPTKEKASKRRPSEFFLECERDARERERERDNRIFELERERIRQRDIELQQRETELQLQAQWLQFMRDGMNILERILNERS